MIHVKRFYAYNQLRNFSYLLYDSESLNCWAIDPYCGDTLKNYIKKMHLNPMGILNTHQHHDHIRGNAVLKEAFNIKEIKDIHVLRLDGQATLTAIDSPGHTMEHQVYLLENGPVKCLFSGDTFFNSGVGNCKHGGDVETLYLTTQKLLATLEDTTLIYPGHDYAENNLKFALQIEPDNVNMKKALELVESEEVESRTIRTLGEEKALNPFFALDRLKLQEKFSNMREKEIFFELRNKRDKW